MNEPPFKIGDKEDGVEKICYASADFGRDCIPRRRAAIAFDKHFLFGKHELCAIDVCFRAVDLVDGDDKGDVGGFDGLDRFDGLRLDAVFGRDDEYRNVCSSGSALAHT
jgi:hypothetical protein